MNTHLKNLLAGMSQVLVLYPENDYQRPERGDFQLDNNVLCSDAARVASDLRNNLAKNVNKIDKRSH